MPKYRMSLAEKANKRLVKADMAFKLDQEIQAANSLKEYKAPERKEYTKSTQRNKQNIDADVERGGERNLKLASPDSQLKTQGFRTEVNYRLASRNSKPEKMDLDYRFYHEEDCLFSVWRDSDSRRAKLARATMLNKAQWKTILPQDKKDVNVIFQMTARYDGLYDGVNLVSCVTQNTLRDGNCLFHAIGFFVDEDHIMVRHKICQFLKRFGHKYLKVRYPEQLQSIKSFAHRISDMELNRTHGGDLEIAAASDIYNVHILVYEYRRDPNLSIHSEKTKKIRLGKVQGNHYFAFGTFEDFARKWNHPAYMHQGFTHAI